jgi:hypothetical protein
MTASVSPTEPVQRKSQSLQPSRTHAARREHQKRHGRTGAHGNAYAMGPRLPGWRGKFRHNLVRSECLRRFPNRSVAMNSYSIDRNQTSLYQLRTCACARALATSLPRNPSRAACAPSSIVRHCLCASIVHTHCTSATLATQGSRRLHPQPLEVAEAVCAAPSAV